jgi:hypothetical protein
VSGSKAVATLLDAVNYRGRIFDVIEEMKSVDLKEDADKWIDFGAWVSHFETCNNVNSKDGIRAGIKASCLNRDGVNRSANYVLLADFANTVGFVMRNSSSRGFIGRNVNKYKDDVTDAKAKIVKGHVP